MTIEFDGVPKCNSCARTHLLRAGNVAAERVVAAGALHVAADLVDLALQLVGRLLRAGQPGQVAGAVALNLHATQHLSASHSTFMPLKSLHLSLAHLFSANEARMLINPSTTVHPSPPSYQASVSPAPWT